MFICGWNALFGRTDKVHGVFFVGTSFFHLFFIPLIPLGSYVVRNEDDDWFGGFKGVPIGFNIKSVIYGWGRAAAIIAILVILWRFFLIYFNYSPSSWQPGTTPWDFSPGWSGILGIAFSVLALWVMRVTSVASSARASELAQRVGHRLEPANVT